MRSGLRSIIMLLATAALFLSACSATTVVTDGSRVQTADSSDDSTASTSQVDDDQADDDEADDDQADDGSTDPAADESEQSGDDDEAGDDEETSDDGSPSDVEAADGFGLGGADQIDALSADCESGSDLACDVLFQLSDFDTEEESVALNCGGRDDATEGFCTEGMIAAAGELYFDDDSPGLSRVIDSCVDDADFTACDFLFFRSGPRSATEEIGGTCGGRVDVAIPDCRTFLGSP